MNTACSDTIRILTPEDMSLRIRFNERERAVLETINRQVSAAKDIGLIIDALFEEMRKIMNCDRIDVALVEDEDWQMGRMVLHYVKTCYKDIYLTKGFSSDIIGGSIQRVFQCCYPSIIDDMEEHARSNPQSDSARLLVKEGIRSSMVCPLVEEGKPVGMLMFRSKMLRAYTTHHVHLQRAVAQRLGQAVEKAHHIGRLSSAINSYMEMLGFVSHELKNPLSSIIMLGNTLAMGYFGEIGEKQQEIVRRIVQKAEYLLNLAGDYLNLAHFETGEFSVNPCEVDFRRDVVSHSLEIVAIMIDEHRILFEQDIQDGLSGVICDPELIKIAITNLLSNGIKYGKRGGKLKITVSSSERRLRISVWNEGPGFPESEKINLFKRFSRIQTPELVERKGHGVGLYVTWKIISLHGGRLWADSCHGEWAEFGFEIPMLMDQCFLPSCDPPQ